MWLVTKVVFWLFSWPVILFLAFLMVIGFCGGLDDKGRK